MKRESNACKGKGLKRRIVQKQAQKEKDAQRSNHSSVIRKRLLSFVFFVGKIMGFVYRGVEVSLRIYELGKAAMRDMRLQSPEWSTAYL